MGILNTLSATKYNASWREISRGHFDEDDYAIISEIEVIPMTYGLGVMITYTSNEVSYIPLSRESCEVYIGEKISPKRCSMITLRRLEQTCEKILIEKE